MLDRVKNAYMELYKICREETDLQRHITKKLVMKHMQEIQNLSEIILDPYNFEEEDDHELICRQWAEIIKDVLDAMEQDDEVLLLDAIAYGILPFVRSLLPNEEWEEM